MDRRAILSRRVGSTYKPVRTVRRCGGNCADCPEASGSTSRNRCKSGSTWSCSQQKYSWLSKKHGWRCLRILIRFENLLRLGQQAEEVLTRPRPFGPLGLVLLAENLARQVHADRIAEIKNETACFRKVGARIPLLRKEFLHLVEDDPVSPRRFSCPAVRPRERPSPPSTSNAAAHGNRRRVHSPRRGGGGNAGRPR